MLCRVAEDVFWLSRYVERAIAVARLIEVTWHLELDAGESYGAAAQFWVPLLGPMQDPDLAPPEPLAQPTAEEVRHFLGKLSASKHADVVEIHYVDKVAPGAAGQEVDRTEPAEHDGDAA